MSISHFREEELEDAFPDSVRRSDAFVRARAVLADIDKFDPAFFGISPRDAALMDPQHRVFLECSWEALEDAGYDHSAYSGSIGVFAGCSLSTYLLRHVLADRRAVERFVSEYQVGMYSELLGALTDTLATRVAYKLDLKGPAATVHTACSTSLFAVAQACQNLVLFQCDMAIAGGVSITVPQARGYVQLEGGMVSSDGQCRPFDAAASGTVFGSGAGAVLLKRAEDAVRDGDHIYALIRGAGVNNDGSHKVGFTAPSSEGQAAAIVMAHTSSGVDPQTIGYVETHGTATPLGDPIEFAGLVSAFAGEGDASISESSPHCALGSVKANIGHLDAAAGVVALIKAALCLKHETIPALVHFKAPNPRIQLEGSPFYVPTACNPWPEGAEPRRAGVSSFGVGGTNVHVVLEEPPRASVSRSVRPVHVLPLSARAQTALVAQREQLASHLEARPELDLSDVAWTLQAGRRSFDHRAAVIVRSRQHAMEQLRQPPSARSNGPKPDGVVFMFPGQGAQFAGMGRGLYEALPQFRARVDRGAALLQPLLGRDIRIELFARANHGESDPLSDTALAQPCLFVIMHALAMLWLDLGVRPAAMVGHSLGEFVAAVIAGALSYESALRFTVARARLMQDAPSGAMLAVRVSEAELTPRLGPDLDLAAVNSPNQCVASGPLAAIEALERTLTNERIAHRRLATSHAFHSAMMDDASAALTQEASRLGCRAPEIPYVSSVTGSWIDAETLRDPLYFARHGRETVRFADSLRTACAGRRMHLITVGPGRALESFAVQTLAAQECFAGATSSLVEADTDEDELAGFWSAASDVWSRGLPIRWDGLNAPARRVSLPTYPFERVRCWADAPKTERESDNVPPRPAGELIVMPNPVELPSRLPRLQAELASILQSVSGSEVTPEQYDLNFLELGFDSLLLGQVASSIQQRWQIKVGFRQLMGEFPSCVELAAHLDERLPREAVAASPAVQAPLTAVDAPADASLASIFQSQLLALQALITQQNELLAAKPILTSVARPSAAPANVAGAPPALPTQPSRYRQFDPTTVKRPREVGETQRAFIEDLTRRYVARTRASRDSTQAHRAKLADPRAASGFRLEWKELCYPIVATHSKGSKLRDLDGNEYVDLVNGYGQTFFGHAPDFVQAAVAEQLKDGFAIGPQSPLAGEVAEMICELVEMDRVTFCNTGSEAVMAAMRVARSVTARDKIAMFANDYHGQFDEVLVRSRAGTSTPTALPGASGIPMGSVANILVLPYGSDESLGYLRAHMHELAAVIVEPVQSRHPELRPYEFLRALRESSAACGTALVFDEVVTGFRVHPGGMQAVTGIRADMATYGKVLGGGMPVGILAGSTRFMDALDGGMWSYGDDSYPEIAPTFFAGTFVRHPLVLAACKAVLKRLRDAGPELQQKLEQRTSALTTRINADLERKGVPSQLHTFSSWFMPNFANVEPLGALFYHQARLLGLHVQDGFPCFLTTEHSDTDIDFVADVFSQSLDALQSAGILCSDHTPAVSTRRLPVAPENAPLTEMQREVWLAAQLSDAASCAFNESVSLSLEGAADFEALRAGLNDVVQRHDALRASFGDTGEHMHIAPSLTIDVPFHDGETDDSFSKRVAVDAATPFNLAEGPLLRAFAARTPGRLVLVLTAHHIVCDGWSMNLIVDELARCYAARLRREAPSLSAPQSYAAHARSVAGARTNTPDVEAYWLAQFKSPPPLPELPLDRARPVRRSFRGATYSMRIDAALHRALKQVSARQGCTLFATLLATFQVLVSRLSGQHDLVVAIPTAGQSLLDDSNLVGHCVNFLPIRLVLEPDAQFAEHLKVVKRQLLAALERQDYTLGTLVRKLELPRDLNRLPLTELQFNLERVGPGLNFEGVTARLESNPKAFANFDVFWNIVESDSGLRVECDYNSDIFDSTTIARWSGHYRTLLDAIVSDPTLPIAELPLLSAGERDWLIDTLNSTEVRYLEDVQLHSLIAAQADRTPQRIAVECAGETLTYAELDVRTDRLARHLRQRLGSSNVRVAIAVERSLDLLVSLVAVMKAGHTYVPLDPEHPRPRLAAIVETAKVAGLICQDAEMAGIAPAASTVVRLDQLAAAIATEDAGPIASKLAADSGAAYVIFTSGSTGTPKGVEVSHRALVNFMRSMARAPGFSGDDTIVAVTTVSFDIAALELFLPLTVGGRVVIASNDAIRGGFGLAELIRSAGATVLQATPALWRILLETKLELPPHFKMLCGGEALSRDLADALLALGGELWNMYGPTETTIWSSISRVAPSPAAIRIGEPIDNTQLYVLDSRGQLQPPGVAGQLYIGGDGLANGYFDRPDLTGASFRLISLAGREQTRVYATGDLARRLADGSIQMLGRIDQQVKLRGYRIEIEEIEVALRETPGVAAAAVALRTSPTGDKRLAGFYVAHPGATVLAEDLSRHIAGSLPEYMVPTAWMRLPSLPLTANGKLDRKALPELVASHFTAERNCAQPTTAMETALSAIFREVLGFEEISVHDSLFSLGADSLHVFRIAARMADRQIPLQAKHLLEYPTIAEAARVAAARASSRASKAGSNGHSAAPSLRDFRHGAKRGSRAV